MMKLFNLKQNIDAIIYFIISKSWKRIALRSQIFRSMEERSWKIFRGIEIRFRFDILVIYIYI